MTAHHYSNSQNSIISFDYSSFLAKNLSNFISLPWKLHNRYCHNCKAIFSTEESWLNHQSGAHSEQITCETCNKTYASVYELNRHVKEIHTKAKSFQCSLCDATFSRKYNCKGAKYLGFFSSRSLKTNERKIYLYIFWGKCVYFSIFEW